MDTARAPRVLVVDDDPDLRELLREYLSANGYAVDTAADGSSLLSRLHHLRPDALVLDVMLPGQDGLTLARAIRREDDLLPILMLSARGDEIDRVVGLEVGADDYLAKPFSPRELLARLRALLRRSAVREADQGSGHGIATERPVAATSQAAASAGSFGPYILDEPARRLLKKGAGKPEEVPLNGAEFDLLALFVRHPNRVLSRDQLVAWLKGYERDAFDRSVDVRVTRLRRRIEPDPSRPRFVRTVRGEGYLFSPLGEDAGG